jgi:hypothetical protein
VEYGYMWTDGIDSRKSASTWPNARNSTRPSIFRLEGPNTADYYPFTTE